MQCPTPSPLLLVVLAFVGGMIGWIIVYFTPPNRK